MKICAAAAGLVCAVFLFAVALHAQTPAAASANTPPLKIRQLTRDIVVAPDGSSTTAVHSEVQVLDQAIIAAVAQEKLAYIDALQDLEVKDAYTLKPDGRKLPLAPDAIVAQMGGSAGSAPVYSDERAKVLIFPDVEVGDTLVYDSVIHAKPELRNSFISDLTIPPTLYIEQQRLTVTAPESMPLYVEGREMKTGSSGSGGNIRYEADYANFNPVSDADEPLSRFERAPRVSISSFKSYQELSAAYAALVEPKIAVTDAIRAKADAVTAGISGRREQAKALYQWVAAHVRYVALEFGAGHIVPHDAESVLDNGYGDCKDHAVLYAALLRAKGIKAETVLITTASLFHAAQVPTFGAFNHMITWLPELGLYADTTDWSTPFGYLPMPEYGKPALLVGPQGALLTTPALAAGQSGVIHDVTVSFDGQAHVTAKSMTTGTGAMSGVLCYLGTMLARTDSKEIMHKMLSAEKMPHATGSLTPAPAGEPSDRYQIGGSYTTPGFWRGVLQEEPFYLPSGIAMVTMTGSLFLDGIAESKYKSAATVPCHSGHYLENYTLELPATLKTSALPGDTAIHTAHLDYSAHWSATAHAIAIRREFTAHFDSSLCSGDTVGEVHDTLAAVRKELESRITLINTVKDNPPPPPR